jgi:hypothetical protein
MPDRIQFSAVTVNAPDAMALARFYAEVTEGAPTGNGHWATLATPNGVINFQQIAGHVPPTWPEGQVPMQMHLEFYVEDLEATEKRVLAAGAVKFGYQPNDDHCYVYADPAGHPFCLSTWGKPEH